MQRLIFKLDPNPNGRGLRCDGDGLFLGRDAFLQKDDEGNFDARPDAELQKTLRRIYGGEAGWESQIRSVKLVANALNKGDMARATMTAVLMRLPDPGNLIRIADIDGALAKAGYDPDELRDEQGRWTNSGGGKPTPNTAHRDPRIQLATDARSDAPNDPVAEAATRAAAARRSLKPTSTRRQSVSIGEESLGQTLRSKLPAEARSLLSAIVRAQADESQADLTAATSESSTIADTLKAYADYLAQPVLDEDGRPVQIYSFPMVSSSAPVFNPGLNLVAPNAPVTRPATNADRIYPLVNLATLFSMGAGQALRLVGPAAELADAAAEALDAADVAANSAKSARTLDRLSAAAGRAAAKVGTGSGRFYGTSVHSAFRVEVDALEDSNLLTERSYLDGVPVDYGTVGAVRLDVVEGPIMNPATIYDLKTGSARLTLSRIRQIRSHLPPSASSIPIKEVRP